MVDNKISELTMMFVIKDFWLSSQDRKQRNRENFIIFIAKRVVVIALFIGIAAIFHSINSAYSPFVYAACCTLYILVKK